MGALEGRVAIITGAGRGIGREHALLFAQEGAQVVVNDFDPEPAQEVAKEVGGIAIAGDVSSFTDAAELIQGAIDHFGRLDVLVNNAGILRDRFIADMTEAEWDAVINVHLKGHFAPLHHAAKYWKAEAKAGNEVRGSVVNTASASGTFLPNPGQANYGAAKAGIAALSLVAAQELARYGVRVNGIAPVARTRLTEDVPLVSTLVAAPTEEGAFDTYHPSHVSPLVAYLSTADCSITGKVFAVQGGLIQELDGWRSGTAYEHTGSWTVAEVASRLT
ncbi:MAG TPA: short-chain dehydrogenase [Micromonosporaceae bacterium]|nr:short-chain dehydrogenase [Micromonosporaceae bacterium]HCU52069.1 short-chain dehydrogenase [Micromonosporaceae bacterium]